MRAGAGGRRAPWGRSALAGVAGLVMASIACGVRVDRSADRGPERPAGVPAGAVWVGGSAGGVFVLVTRATGDSARPYRGQVFHENGEIWYEGALVLEPAEGPSVDLTDARSFTGWDGEKLLLADGRALRPVGRAP